MNFNLGTSSGGTPWGTIGNIGKTGYNTIAGKDDKDYSDLEESIIYPLQGASMGAQFGPWGAVAGAVYGLGYSFKDDLGLKDSNFFTKLLFPIDMGDGGGLMNSSSLSGISSLGSGQSLGSLASLLGNIGGNILPTSNNLNNSNNTQYKSSFNPNSTSVKWTPYDTGSILEALTKSNQFEQVDIPDTIFQINNPQVQEPLYDPNYATSLFSGYNLFNDNNNWLNSIDNNSNKNKGMTLW